ncbi:MAG: methyl-accepting chemotaxis protein [Coleofasciculus chthonoplastes F3-SA18-01]|uniref:methyl-accepting chemotaxis protein n=1 Tax=Coleofasciculus chthonoplastes TaxID=64178 RepID=UPI0032FD6FF3
MLRTFLKNLSNQKKLQNQILLLLFLSSLIPVSIVGLYGIFSSSTALSEVSETKLEDRVADDAENIGAVLDGINEDVLFLSKIPEIKGLIQATADGGTDTESNQSSEAWTDQAETIFTSLMQAKAEYMQLRFIDENGQEVVRVDSDGTTTTVIPKSELQNKGDRGYFTETMKLEPGEVYVSPVNLNQEQGKIETPFKPVIRYATPVADAAGNKQGIVIANVFATKFLQYIEEAKLSQGETALLVNSDGYYLSHPDDEKEWGFDIGTDETLAKDYSDQIVEQVLQGNQGLIGAGSNELISYATVDPDPNQPGFLVAIRTVPKSTIFASVTAFKVVATLIILISLAAVLPVGVFRTRQLADLVKQIVTRISTSSQEIFSTLEEQERVASQQAASVNETTTTMDELEASSRQSAEQAKAAVAAAQKALELTKGGTQAVGETLEGMYTLENKVGAIAQQIVRLSEQANQIGSISQLVSELANKTNMLALNSSVEAVRAGEHGKGFSVVANEIRKLADQSQQSADKIGILVSEIQSAINSTVMVTDEGTKTVASGVQIAQKTNEAFTGVADAVDKVVLNNQQISLNLKQQVDAIQQVVEAMETINKGAKETATGINQTKIGTQQLNETSLELQEMV